VSTIRTNWFAFGLTLVFAESYAFSVAAHVHYVDFAEVDAIGSSTANGPGSAFDLVSIVPMTLQGIAMNDDAYVIPGAPGDGGAFSRQLNSNDVLERNDAILLGLETRFQAMADELRTAGADGNDSEIEDTATLERVEAILARLYPVERAIMMTPADTVVGLAVKARHAAYVLSEYWEVPLEHHDWDRRAVRLLIEAVCHVARATRPRVSRRSPRS
jgi:hypothetical protein